MPRIDDSRIAELSSLSPKARAKLTGEVKVMVAELLAGADKMHAQAVLDELWESCAEAEPNVATMALIVAGLTARALSMFADEGVPMMVMVPALSMLTAVIADQQMQADRAQAEGEHDAGHA